MALPSEIIPALLAFAGGVGAGIFFARRRPFSGRSAVASAPIVDGQGVAEGGLAVFAESLREVVLILDKTDRVVYFNRAARGLPGVDDTSIGRDAAVVVRSADFLEYLRHVRAGRRQGGPADIVIRRSPLGNDLALEALVAPLPETAGYGPGALAIVMTDVSRLRRLESLRREFVANVSHDLRTPVTIIKGFAQTLAEDYEAMSDEDVLRFLEKIQRNARRLHILLEDLLELSSLEDGGAASLELKPGALHAELRDAVEVLEERFVAAGIAVEFDLAADDTRVGIDPPKFSRVVQNLLENALRYATGATRVRIATRTVEGGVELRVEDDGPGIAQGEYEKVFERFYRAEKSRSVAGGGSGLGLSIVKHIILAHGGEVKAGPALPRGFAVNVLLPLAPA